MSYISSNLTQVTTGSSHSDQNQSHHSTDEKILEVTKEGLTGVRESWMHFGKDLPTAIKAKIAAPEAILAFMINYSNNTSSAFPIFDSVTDAIPEVGINFIEGASPYLIGSFIAAEVGEAMETGTPTFEQYAKLCAKRPSLAGSEEFGTAVIAPTLLQAPQKVLRALFSAGGQAIRTGLKYVKPSLDATAKLGCVWAHSLAGKDFAGCLLGADDFLAQNKEKFVEHVKKVRSDYDLSDKQTALYTIAAYGAASHYLGNAARQLPSDSEFKTESFKTALKKELSPDPSKVNWTALRSDLDGIRKDFFSTSKGELSLEATLQLYMMGQVSFLYSNGADKLGWATQMPTAATPGAVVPQSSQEERIFESAMQLKQTAALFESQQEDVALFAKDGALKESIEQLEGFNEELSAWQAEHQDYLIQKKKEEFALHLASAALNGFSEWQNAQTAEAAENFQRTEKIKDVQQQRQLTEQQQFWSHNYNDRMPVGVWVNREIIKTVGDLNGCLDDLKQLENKYKSIRDSAEHKMDALLIEQEKILSRKRKAKGLLKTLGIVLSVVTVICPPVAVAAGAVGAAQAYSNRKDAERQMRTNGQANDLQRQFNGYSMTANQANQRVMEKHAEANQLLDYILDNRSQFPPQVVREAFRKKVEQSDEVLKNYDDQLKEVEAQIKKKQDECKPDRKHPDRKPDIDKEIADRELLNTSKADCNSKKGEYVKQLKKEEEIAAFQDHAYSVQTYWTDFWSPKTEEGKNLARAIEYSRQTYIEGTAEERKAILQTLQVLEGMGWVIGSPKGLSWARAGLQAYTIFDIARGFYDRAPVLSKMLKTAKVVENFPLKLLTEFFVPGMSIVIAAIQLYRLATQEHQAVTGDNYAFTQLQNQLGDLHSRIDALAQLNQSQYRDILEQVGKSKLFLDDAIKKLAGLVTDEFKKLKIENNEANFNRETSSLNSKNSEIAIKVQQFRAEIRRGRKVAKDKFKEFIDYLDAALIRSRKDFSNGWNAPNFPAYTSLIYRHPFAYTGLTAGLLGSKVPVPNLQIFLHVYDGYLAAREANAADAEVQADLDEMKKSLSEQATVLAGFYANFPSACNELATLQAQLLGAVEKVISNSQEKEERARFVKIETDAVAVENSFGKCFQGVARFGLSTYFKNKKKPIELPTNQKLLEFGWSKMSRNFIVAGSEAAKGLVTKTIHDTAAKGIVEYAYSISVWMNQTRLTRLGQFFSQEISVHEAEKTDKKDLILTVKVVARRKLNELAVSLVTISPERLDFKTETDLSNTCEVMSLDFHTTHQGRCMTTYQKSFQLTVEEKSAIPEFYPENSINQTSLEAYLNFIRGNTEEWKGINRDECVIIPGNQAGMIPLAIPRSILGEYEILERKLALKGVQLTPLYSCQYVPEAKCYRLIIEWRNGTSTASMVLAQFDAITVIAFGAPIINGEVLVQELSPTLNEFLLHAVYGSKLGVGLPGNRTKQIGALLAPVDEEFPGLFELLNKTGREFNFVHGLYKGPEQLSDAVSASKFFPRPLQLKIDVTNLGTELHLSKIRDSYRQYCQKYDAVKAMFSAVSSDKTTDVMERSGFRVPTSGVDQELYDFVTNTSPRSDALIGGSLIQYAEKGGLSSEYKALRGALSELKD